MLKWVMLADLYSPLIAVVREHIYGGPCTGYSVPADTTVSAWRLAHMLRRRGVKVFGVDMQVNWLVFSVPRKQAGIVDAVLSAEGIPYQRGGK